MCPFSAIVMVEDKKGFLYPVIDKNKCRDCGLCKSVCQTHKVLSEVEESKTFKFVLDDNTVRQQRPDLMVLSWKSSVGKLDMILSKAWKELWKCW